METHRFDGLTRTLAAPGSRRRILAALAGGLLAFLGGRGAGAADDKVLICHKTTSDSNQIVLIDVSVNAVADHLAHGDFRHDGCCVDADCGGGQPCVNGACCGDACDNGDGYD
jgi:hypothetical protein